LVLGKRDEFREPVKHVIAARAGFRCSYPECQTCTVGPTVDTAKNFNIGAACHITAAAEGGSRYDPDMTREQRKHPDNGIWMCRTHADLVDDDALKYPVDLLRTWKKEAEDRVLREVGKAEALGTGGVRFAELSPAERWGVNSKVILEDGTEITSSTTFNLARQDIAIFAPPIYTLRFLVLKVKGIESILLYSLQAMLYKYDPLPKNYRKLAYAYPQTVFPYILHLEPPIDERPRPCPCELYCPPGQDDAVPFAPLVINEDIPQVIDAWFTASSGIYTFALDAVMAWGTEKRTFRVLTPTAVLFEKFEELYPD
jgi:hypothetical protein